MSRSVIESGAFGSPHIMDLESKVIKNQFGKDLITSDIDMVSVNHRKGLLDNGIIGIGSIVFGNDILIGKLSHIALAIEKPSIDEDKSKLDNDVFNGFDENNKINNMLDSSLRVPK